MISPFVYACANFPRSVTQAIGWEADHMMFHNIIGRSLQWGQRHPPDTRVGQGQAAENFVDGSAGDALRAGLQK